MAVGKLLLCANDILFTEDDVIVMPPEPTNCSDISHRRGCHKPLLLTSMAVKNISSHDNLFIELKIIQASIDATASYDTGWVDNIFYPVTFSCKRSFSSNTISLESDATYTTLTFFLYFLNKIKSFERFK